MMEIYLKVAVILFVPIYQLYRVYILFITIRILFHLLNKMKIHETQRKTLTLTVRAINKFIQCNFSNNFLHNLYHTIPLNCNATCSRIRIYMRKIICWYQSKLSYQIISNRNIFFPSRHLSLAWKFIWPTVSSC